VPLRITLLFAAALSACAGAGNQCNGVCPDLSAGGGSEDMAVPSGDMTVVDLSSTAGKSDLSRVYVPATLHEIDTGGVADGTYVLVSGVVLTTPVHARTTSGGMCTYQAWAQDPAGAAPSGIQLFDVQPAVSASCPLPPSSGGVFDGHPEGQNVDIRGKLYIATFGGDGGTLTQHSLYVDSFTTLSATNTVTPTALDNPAQFGGYGAGFDAYEGMLITLTCGTGSACTASSNKLKVTFIPGPYLWGVTGGGLFGSEFSSLWPGKPGAVNTAYTSLTGVVSTFLTGSIEPRGSADFVP
jgi:hypothetical protein